MEVSNIKFDRISKNEKDSTNLEILKKLVGIYNKGKQKQMLTKEEFFLLFDVESGCWDEFDENERMIEELSDYIFDSCLYSPEENVKLIVKGESTTKDCGYFCWLITATGLEDVQIIDSNADCYSMVCAKGFKNLEAIVGNANFMFLKKSEGLSNLRSVGGFAFFDELEDAGSLGNLSFVGESIFFNNLSCIDGFECLKSLSYFKKIIFKDATYDLEEFLRERQMYLERKHSNKLK